LAIDKLLENYPKLAIKKFLLGEISINGLMSVELFNPELPRVNCNDERIGREQNGR
jgi:hypothetical protein